ncbi:MAG: FAD-dependent monooxygenase [Gammaproteobacteria bacterium]|nr:FAD-dependent monooxygenase [Gammaproteobacteria bacterium]
MTTSYQTDIAVVGAGMVGSACAAMLAQQGHAVLLLDRQPAQAYQRQELPDLRVSAIAPGNQRMLQQLGAWPLIEAQRCTPYDVMEVTTGSGGQLRFVAGEHGLGELGWIIENGLLQSALASVMPVSVERVEGVAVSGLTQRRRAVALQLEDGSSVSARLVVAADGARSALRELCGLPLHTHDYAQQAVVAVLETELPNPGIAWQVHLPTGPLAMLPVGAGRSSLVWSLPSAMAAEQLKLSSDALAAALTLHSNGRFGKVRVVSAVAAFPLRLQLARQLVQQRVVLVGDAAHQVHPMAGQGVNLGFQDVLELVTLLGQAQDQVGSGNVLAAAQSSERLQSMLASYERRRLSDNTIMARGINALETMFRHQQRLAALGITVVDRLLPLKSLFIRRACAVPVLPAKSSARH